MLTSIYKLSVSCVKMEHAHTHPFNGPFSGTTRVSRYQKGKTNLDFTEARDSEWQWHQLDHMQVCISLDTDNHASTPPLKVFYMPDALPAAQPTASKHWRQRWNNILILNLCYFVLLKIETISLLFLFSFVTQFIMLICYTLMVCWFWFVWSACVLLQKSFVILSWKGLVRLLRYRLWKVFILHAYCLQPPLSVIY